MDRIIRVLEGIDWVSIGLQVGQYWPSGHQGSSYIDRGLDRVENYHPIFEWY